MQYLLSNSNYCVNPVRDNLPAQHLILSQSSSPNILPHEVSAAEPTTGQYVTYPSAVLGSDRTYGLVLPPGYDQHPNQRYPVIFMLHGGHGQASDWLEKGNAAETLQLLYKTGKLPPSIVIMPDGNDKRGSSPYWDPQYINGVNGDIATAIGDELVKVVQSRYRTLPTPDFWAIGGLSSGGWGAINVGLHHLDHFSVLFSHSGYFVDTSGAENSPLAYIQTLPESQLKKLRIYLDVGKSDRRYLLPNLVFHQMLDRLGVSHVLHEFSGSHRWGYWHTHLADSLSYIGEQFHSAQMAHADRLH